MSPVQAKLVLELTGYKTFEGVISSGITVTNTTTFTVATAGLYTVFAQQLITTGGASIYLRVDINNISIHHGYLTAGIGTTDVHASITRSLSVGDTIRVNLQNTATTVWGGNHSSSDCEM